MKKPNLQELLAIAKAKKQASTQTDSEQLSNVAKAAEEAKLNVQGTYTARIQEPKQEPKPSSNPKPMSKLEELRARLKASAAGESERQTTLARETGTIAPDEEIVCSVDLIDGKQDTGETTGMSGEAITYNEEQQEFIELIAKDESCVLIGAAGTGKTTCSQGGVKALIESGRVPVLDRDGHKHLISGTPGVIIISYTRRAVNNIRKVQSEDLKPNCITSHKLLEYQPEKCIITDPETGMQRESMRFVPNRDASNPLPSTIHTVIVEEASMLSVELYTELTSALVQGVQWVFIGDIQQLPPVFGSAILGFKLLELPVVELKTVYRQALESPIIRLAHRILSGVPIPAEEYAEWKDVGKLTLHPWKKRLSDDLALQTLAAFFKSALDNKVYNVEEDMILIPYNKGCGTIELNNHIANHIARTNDELTYEVMAGFNKLYFSVGDKVLYDREDAEIIEIKANPAYTGARVQPPSRTLDYWGHNPNIMEESGNSDLDDYDVEFLLEQASSSEERVTQASHEVVVRLLDSGYETTLRSAAQLNALLLSYALTVHKSQGSEWRKVFFCLHQSHATMLQRELVYTGVTRAREELYVICEPDSLTKGILRQKIKGNTLAEKAVFFKGKLSKSGSYI